MAEKRVCRSVLLKQIANQPITGQELNHCSEDNLLKVKASEHVRKGLSDLLKYYKGQSSAFA